MAKYAKLVQVAPRTLTEKEQVLLLRATGEHRDGFRDHVLFSLALGTGLREHEIVALNVGDVMDGDGVRQRVLLKCFKGSWKAGRTDDGPVGAVATTTPGTAIPASNLQPHQETVLPDVLRAKLAKFLNWKRRQGERLEADSPLFVSRNSNRLSTRQLRRLFHLWQQRAGFERRLPFHALRHTACSTLYRNTKDIRLTQRFARHASVVTTSIYAHPSDEDLLRAVRQLAC